MNEQTQPDTEVMPRTVISGTDGERADSITDELEACFKQASESLTSNFKHVVLIASVDGEGGVTLLHGKSGVLRRMLAHTTDSMQADVLKVALKSIIGDTPEESTNPSPSS